MFRGPRARRGDVRVAILMVLAERPGTGYGIIQALEDRSGGAWRPSPGSVYPTLEQLISEGLVSQTDQEGAKMYALTETGQRHVATHRESFDARCEEMASEHRGGRAAMREMRGEISQLMIAVYQVAQAGTDRQRAAAERLLAETRRRLYGILADEEDTKETQ